MPPCRRFLFCLVLLGTLVFCSGCEMFSSEAWQRPSPLSGPPPPLPEKHERGGGIAVLVGLPGQPPAARAMADLGTYAQSRGFVRLSSAVVASGNVAVEPAPQHYQSGDLKLDVAYQGAELRVTAFLHGFSSKMNRRFVDEFYQGFCQEYAPRYGAEASIIENEYSEDVEIPASNTGENNRDKPQRGR